MSKALLLSKLETALKKSLDNLEDVNISNLHKSKALALEVLRVVDSVFIDEEKEERYVSNR